MSWKSRRERFKTDIDKIMENEVTIQIKGYITQFTETGESDKGIMIEKASFAYGQDGDILIDGKNAGKVQFRSVLPGIYEIGNPIPSLISVPRNHITLDRIYIKRSEIESIVESKKKFYQLFKEGLVSKESIYDYVERWHEGESDEHLADYLGMPDDVYSKWMRTGEL